MSQRSTPGLRERKKARTRAAIQAHALRLFREQGYQRTTIEQIINAAEVSETTFFRYFPTKEAVVLEDELDPEIVDAIRRQPEDLPPLRAVRNALREVFGALEPDRRRDADDRLMLVLAEPSIRAAMLDQLFQAMRTVAEALAERAGRPHDDPTIRSLAGAAVGVMLAAMATVADDPATDLAAALDQAFERLEGGLSSDS